MPGMGGSTYVKMEQDPRYSSSCCKVLSLWVVMVGLYQWPLTLLRWLAPGGWSTELNVGPEQNYHV